MHTQELKIRIENTTKKFLPLFKVTEGEFIEFKLPEIKRSPSSQLYDDYSRKIPAYSSIENFFYFPAEDPGLIPNVFSEGVINHEVGHYIHSQINPIVITGKQIFLKTGKLPTGNYELTEIVVEYGNFILNLDYYDNRTPRLFKDFKERYDKYGHEFLPFLARMNEEEAIRLGIIKLKE